TLEQLLGDLKSGVWSELNSGGAIDPYRRNLQRTYIQAIHSLMENEEDEVMLSDIKPMLRDELRQLAGDVEEAVDGSPDRITRVHLQDIGERIENILDPS
ncbi:MAG: zinc-dependent metalloprotease, partial [Balneolaceae bacterium]